VPAGTYVRLIEVQDLSKEGDGRVTACEPDKCQSLEIAALDPVAMVKVILENEECRQGRGEVVDRLWLVSALVG